MASEKEEIILDFKVEQGEAIKELEQTKIAIINLKKEQAELNKAYKSGEKSTEEYAQELVRLEGELKKNNNAYNQNLKAAKGVETQFDKLIKTNKELTSEVKKNTDTTKASIESFSVQGVSLGDLTGKIAGMATGVGVATAAVGALVAVLARGRQAQELFAQASAFTSGALDKLTKDTTKLAKETANGDEGPGLIKSFLASNAVVQGLVLSFKALDFITGGYITTLADAGEEAAKFEAKLQDIRIEQLTATEVSKDLLRQEERLRQERDNTTLSLDQRIIANEKILDLEKQRADELTKLNSKELEIVQAQIENIGRENASFELLQREAELRNEIADILEDSAGKESEVLNARIALQTELNAKLLEQSEIERARRIALVEQEFATEQQRQDIKIELSNKSAKVELDNTAKILAARTDANKKEIANKKQEQIQDSLVTQAKLQNATTVLQVGQQLLKEGSAGAKAAAIAVTTAQTISAATAALAPPPVGVGPVFGPILAAITTALGLANVGKIAGLSFAAGGGSFMTNGPHLMMVGDNPGGRERVDVTPISGKGQTSVGSGIIKMAGGGSVVANASSSRIDQSFAAANLFKDMNFSVSWREGNELGNKIRFKEELTTA